MLGGQVYDLICPETDLQEVIMLPSNRVVVYSRINKDTFKWFLCMVVRQLCRENISQSEMHSLMLMQTYTQQVSGRRNVHFVRNYVG